MTSEPGQTRPRILVPDGNQALAREESFDLILMDIQMPNLDGYAATRAIRAMEREKGGGRRLVIHALSAHASATTRQDSLACGCDEHLVKPIDKQRLLQAINQVAAAGTGPEEP
ncbi:MAG: response regulator [Magnetococcales bacterium]|nr:response regulator [Magnetococcales bacterium]